MTNEPQYIIEGIILRRLHEKRIEGYTIDTAKEIADALALRSEVRSGDVLAGLDERLDRLLLTSNENERFVLSTQSAKNIVGIVREWIRPDGVAQTPLPTREDIAKIIDAMAFATVPGSEAHTRALHKADAILALSSAPAQAVPDRDRIARIVQEAIEETYRDGTPDTIIQANNAADAILALPIAQAQIDPFMEDYKRDTIAGLIEHCASVAETYSDQGRDGHQIAKAIRALATPSATLGSAAK